MHLLAIGAAGILLLGVLAALVVPRLGDLVGEGVDTAELPNSNAVAAGTPVAQFGGVRPTPVLRPTIEPAAVAPVDVQPQPSPAAGEPTAGSAASAAVAAGGAVVFEDAFADNSRRWPSGPGGPATLVNGSYRLAPRQAGQFTAVAAPIVDLSPDVIVNAVFRKLGGPAGGGYGIILRDQSAGGLDGLKQDGQYYVLEAGDNGEVGIWRRDGNRWIDLLPWQPNAAVRPGSATNELIAQAVGSRLSLTVNGTTVATRTDDALTGGGVGVFVGGDGNDVSLDRFRVQTP
jgi:hypothetical protein